MLYFYVVSPTTSQKLRLPILKWVISGPFNVRQRLRLAGSFILVLFSLSLFTRLTSDVFLNSPTCTRSRGRNNCNSFANSRSTVTVVSSLPMPNSLKVIPSTGAPIIKLSKSLVISFIASAATGLHIMLLCRLWPVKHLVKTSFLHYKYSLSHNHHNVKGHHTIITMNNVWPPL